MFLNVSIPYSFPFDHLLKGYKFYVHYLADFTATFIHFTIYAAASGFHISTGSYLLALISDLQFLLNQSNKIIQMTDLSETLRRINIHENLIKSIKLHTKLIKYSQTK